MEIENIIFLEDFEKYKKDFIKITNNEEFVDRIITNKNLKFHFKEKKLILSVINITKGQLIYDIEIKQNKNSACLIHSIFFFFYTRIVNKLMDCDSKEDFLLSVKFIHPDYYEYSNLIDDLKFNFIFQIGSIISEIHTSIPYHFDKSKIPNDYDYSSLEIKCRFNRAFETTKISNLMPKTPDPDIEGIDNGNVFNLTSRSTNLKIRNLEKTKRLKLNLNLNLKKLKRNTENEENDPKYVFENEKKSLDEGLIETSESFLKHIDKNEIEKFIIFTLILGFFSNRRELMEYNYRLKKDIILDNFFNNLYTNLTNIVNIPYNQLSLPKKKYLYYLKKDTFRNFNYSRKKSDLEIYELSKQILSFFLYNEIENTLSNKILESLYNKLTSKDDENRRKKQNLKEILYFYNVHTTKKKKNIIMNYLRNLILMFFYEI